MDSGVFDRARSIADALLAQEKNIAVMNNDGIRAIVDGTIAEVALCEEWGDARPEEGGEHFLAYRLEELTGDHYIHGNLIALNILTVLKLQDKRAVYDWRRLKGFFDAVGVEYSPQSQSIRKEDYALALETVGEYVKKRGLFKGLWHLENVFEKDGERSVDEIVEWVWELEGED